jgi:hypothetical protein
MVPAFWLLMKLSEINLFSVRFNSFHKSEVGFQLLSPYLGAFPQQIHRVIHLRLLTTRNLWITRGKCGDNACRKIG